MAGEGRKGVAVDLLTGQACKEVYFDPTKLLDKNGKVCVWVDVHGWVGEGRSWLDEAPLGMVGRGGGDDA
jgi:hypothetical protein